MSNKDNVLTNLKRKALGYEVTESTVEFVIDEEGNRRAVKEKMQQKVMPPDTQAIKLYYELLNATESLETLSDEELLKEKERLLAELK